MKILIVGGGLGGITLAAFLEQFQIEYEMVEKSPDWTHQGYSLGIWSNCRDLLLKLGLEKELEGFGVAVKTYDMYDETGEHMRRFIFDPFYKKYDMAYTHVDRSRLHSMIASKTPNLKINWSTSVIALDNKEDGVSANFTDGRKKIFDVVVGADGIDSTVRDLVFGANLEKQINWRVWYVRMDKRYRQACGMTEYFGPGSCIGIFDEGETALGTFFTNRKLKNEENLSAKEKVRQLFAPELEILKGALDNCYEKEIVESSLSTLNLKSWHKGRVILLGDAAHAQGPHTGLGASMAMEDAYVLAKELEKVKKGKSIDIALEDYFKLRKRRIKLVEKLANRLRLLSFIDSRIMRKLSNNVIKIVPDKFFLKDYFSLLNEKM